MDPALTSADHPTVRRSGGTGLRAGRLWQPLVLRRYAVRGCAHLPQPHAANADAGAEPHPLLRPVVEVAGRRRGGSAAAERTDAIRTTATTWPTCGAPSRITLDEQIEQVINTKDANGIDAVMTLYDMLTSRLEFTLEVDGEEQTLTRDALMSYVHSPMLTCAPRPIRNSTASTRTRPTSWRRCTPIVCATGTRSRWNCAATPRPSPCATSPTTSRTRQWTRCWTCAASNVECLPALLSPQGRLAWRGQAASL